MPQMVTAFVAAFREVVWFGRASRKSGLKTRCKSEKFPVRFVKAANVDDPNPDDATLLPTGHDARMCI
jgi:hypothetical protein